MKSSTPANDARLRLVKSNRAAIYGVLCRAASSGHSMGDAVALVADMTNLLGREMAKAATLLPGTISDDQSFPAVDLEQQASTAIIVMTVVAARDLLTPRYKSIADGLDRQPALGCVRVVAITQGSPILVHTDVRPSAPIAKG